MKSATNDQLVGKAVDQSNVLSAVSPNLEQLELSTSNGYSTLGCELLLYALQSPINIGIILRVAEAFQFRVSIFDLHRVLDNEEKLATIRDFSCGALSRRAFDRITDANGLAELRKCRRLIATSITSHAVPLTDFKFAPGDILALGNEYDGLPGHLEADADCLVRVPMPPGWMPKEMSYSPIDPSRTTPVAHDGQPSLNVAVTAGIICYAAFAHWSVKKELE